MLGPWTADLPRLARAFAGGDPFDHVVIDNFLTEDLARAVVAEFPATAEDGWCRYHNPIEQKFARNAFEGMPMTQRVVDMLQSPQFVDVMSRLSGIPDLESDPHLHGAGLHYHPRGGKLDMHLDYGLHPVTGKERRLNLILYLNEAWNEAWGGHLELWDASFTECRRRVAPHFNRAALFKTSDASYHGMPRPLTCPDGEGRKSLAVYYVSPPREGVAHRFKAEFRPLPGQPVDHRLQALYDIRRTRLITQADLDAIWPRWEAEGGPRTRSETLADAPERDPRPSRFLQRDSPTRR